MPDISSTFIGSGRALSPAGIEEATDQLGVDAATVWALVAVETAGCGFLSDRRPQILYERHLFHRLTGGAHDDGDISAPEAGGYGPQGRHQYDRLSRALALDREAALKSTSWGLGQVLGLNAGDAGFDSIDAMVTAMCGSEDRQLAAVASFVRTRRLDSALRRKDWTSFASRYNGPAYQANRYDIRLNAEYQKYSVGLVPDLTVRTAQLYLTYLGYHPGTIDGIAGSLTRAAVVDFQRASHLTPIGVVDDMLIAHLSAQLPESTRV